MTPTIVARHFNVSDALRSHVDQCAARLPKFLDNVVSCHVALSVEKHRRVTEVTVSVSGHTLKATAQSHSLYISIDDAFTRLIRQLKRQNEKQNAHRPAIRKPTSGSGQRAEEVG